MLKGLALKLNQQIYAKTGVVASINFLLILLLTSRWNDDFPSFFNNAADLTCHTTPSPYINTTINPPLNSSQLCPEFFCYIHEDWKPWKSTGISKEMVESDKHFANFRLVISDGRAYMKKYKHSFQTWDILTLWGIVQLLNRYSGHVPDLNLMFECADLPLVKASDYSSAPAPLLFRYCQDDTMLDIVFPDWVFWGWPEMNIKPWEAQLEEIKMEREKFNWTNRQLYAYWKGHAGEYANRKDLLSCNVSKDHEWNARIFNK